MRRFYAPQENFSDRRIVLDTEQSRHLRNVLRLRVSDEVRVFDGTGREFLCLIQEYQKNSPVLRLIEEIRPASPESGLDLTLAVALLKGDKFDLVIQKAVELGVRSLVPIITKRCDVKLKNPANKLERWQKIVIEASKQCGRARLMEISAPIGFEEFIDETAGAKILFAERNGENFSALVPQKKITAYIGPEGGWDETEIEFAGKQGVQIVTLTGRILRAETAAIAIPAILQHRFGDFV